MSDHADKLRDILELTDCSRGMWEPLLDALVAERDEVVDAYHARLREKRAAEARVAALEDLLVEWLTADPNRYDWLDFEQRVRAALAGKETT